jgi:hypothetical protein
MHTLTQKSAFLRSLIPRPGRGHAWGPPNSVQNGGMILAQGKNSPVRKIFSCSLRAVGDAGGQVSRPKSG